MPFDVRQRRSPITSQHLQLRHLNLRGSCLDHSPVVAIVGPVVATVGPVVPIVGPVVGEPPSDRDEPAVRLLGPVVATTLPRKAQRNAVMRLASADRS
jgi:hypothetical protein